MDWIMDNMLIILCMVCVITMLTFYVLDFLKKPREQQIAALKKFLYYAVAEAETKLGQKTGQLKLHMVYNMALAQFSWIEKLVTFDEFSEYVDEALEWMKEQLEKNPNIKDVIIGD